MSEKRIVELATHEFVVVVCFCVLFGAMVMRLSSIADALERAHPAEKGGAK